jgi:hypothetical protein
MLAIAVVHVFACVSVRVPCEYCVGRVFSARQKKKSVSGELEFSF